MTETEKDYYCDFHCLFRDVVFSEIKDCDEAERFLQEYYCKSCIIHDTKQFIERGKKT